MSPPDSATERLEPLFPQLSGGNRKLPPEEVAKHQVARLQGAMVEAVGRHGYGGTTLRELVTLAGVSKSTFYDHFESKQDCFLATFDEIVDQLGVRVGAAYRSGGDFRGQLIAGLAAFMNLAVEETAAATLAAVDSLTLGAAGVAHRERAQEAFEVLVQQSFDHSPAERQVSPLIVRATVAGIRGVAYRRLRAGRAEELPGTVEELVDWALRYQRPDSAATERAIAAASRQPEQPIVGASAGSEEELGWEEPPDSKRSRAQLSQRERIARASARVVIERGYESLSIPAISAAAGTSNQTFYEHFASKRDAFLAAFSLLAERVLATTIATYEAEEERPEAIGAALRVILEHVAADELFAQLAFFELPTAGPVALDAADAMLDSFAVFLGPESGEDAFGSALSPVLLVAVPSAVWAVIQHEIVHGRRESLPTLAPDIARVLVAPFGDAPAAAKR